MSEPETAWEHEAVGFAGLDLSLAQKRQRWLELAAVFLRLGFTAFGGPAAHIALFRDETVKRRKWLSEQQFLDFLAAANLIPGPNSTELVIHLGLLRGGWPGFFIAGLCFILPATAIVLALSWMYVRYGALPQAGWLLYGIKPVIIAVIFQALWSFGKTAFKNTPTVFIGICAAILSFLGLNEILLVSAGGLVMLAWQALKKKPGALRGVFLLPVPVLGLVQTAALDKIPYSLGLLFLTFLKIGSVLFGSGYVLLAFLEADFVTRLGWLTESQLIDAVAIGQVTPGPLFTAATFIGYLLGGAPAALLATLGIFLPSFFFVAASHSFVPRMRRSPLAGQVLDGVVASSLGLMAVVALKLTFAALVDPWTWLLAGVSFILFLRFRINSTWLVLLGAIAGVLIKAGGLP